MRGVSNFMQDSQHCNERKYSCRSQETKVWYEGYKPLLFSLAYQLTGSVTDAEDAVQDVFLKLYERHEGDAIQLANMQYPKAYLCKMVTNRCHDLMRSARKKREQYYGQWLPEPADLEAIPSYEEAEQKEMLSYAVLVMLEKLSPPERVVFVLREAFGFEYAAVAAILDKNEVNCRKMYSRAKAKMGLINEPAANDAESGLPEQLRKEAVSESWIKQLLFCLQQGKAEQTAALLSQDVELISDGGGQVTAALHPIVSRDYVLRFLTGIIRKAATDTNLVVNNNLAIRYLNGQPSVIFQSNGKIDTAAMLHMEDGLLKRIYLIRNPQKLNKVGL